MLFPASFSPPFLFAQEKPLQGGDPCMCSSSPTLGQLGFPSMHCFRKELTLAVYISTLGFAALALYVAAAYSLFSTTHFTSKPAFFNPNDIPPTPANRSTSILSVCDSMAKYEVSLRVFGQAKTKPTPKNVNWESHMLRAYPKDDA